MKRSDLEAMLQQPAPPDALQPLIEALWWASHGDWEHAHIIAQDIDTQEGAWVHAYLHRLEGDDGNAGYWYRQAGRPRCTLSLDAEWREIASALLDG